LGSLFFCIWPQTLGSMPQCCLLSYREEFRDVRAGVMVWMTGRNGL
jgi:hypothetical protein